MRRSALNLIAFGILLASTTWPAMAQDFKPYAGSKLDEQASREASAAVPGKRSQVYTTADSFEKVNAFYKSLYKEYTALGSGRKMGSGQQLQWNFFILDGAKDLKDSKSWMKIQRPYVGAANDVRDVTVIQTVGK